MTYYTDTQEIYDLYSTAKTESKAWREDYHEFERLADNDLIDDQDPDLPEVNDGSLSASLFKLPKRIVSTDLKGRAKATDRDDAWLTELANMQWENEIIPNANSQAPFHRKWKDAVRKASIYGSVPLITIFVERGNYVGTDFICVQPQDVTLEPGKVSDYDSDIIFWDVYYTKKQIKDMIARAKKEEKEGDSYNKWDIKALEDILKMPADRERETYDDHRETQDKEVRKKGINFCVIFQRGVEAPFYMYHKDTKKIVREWKNQDPTGDIPIHFLYCYQDFVNPYGIGIVKLAGGTQNVLDYMRQADVLATQIGIKPPISIGGDIDSADLSSLVYEQDAQWYVGTAQVRREELGNNIYSQLPTRMSMYKLSLDQMIPSGDTSISAGSGDLDYSKTPAGVKFQQANLSIDDEDFKDNLYLTYAAVAKSMINIHFANMQGSDIMKLSDDERDILSQAGIEFPVNQFGEPTNELEVIWDEARATFDFEIEPENDKAKDEEKRLEALLKIVELRAADPTVQQELQSSGKRLNIGELYATIISLTSDNDKIIEDISPEEQEQLRIQQQGEQQPEDYSPREEINYKDAPPDIQRQMERAAGYQPSEMATLPQQETDIKREKVQTDKEKNDLQAQTAIAKTVSDKQQQALPDQDQINLEAVMREYEVDENTAQAMLEAEKQGLDPGAIVEALTQAKGELGE